MFDLTKEIGLEGKWKNYYARSRAALFAFFGAAFLILAFAILFPTSTFDYFFTLKNDSLKNTVSTPRSAADAPILNGQIPANGSFTFDNLVTGNFSAAKIDYFLAKDSSLPAKTELTVRRSYHSFFYPIGSPLGFRDGTLLANAGYYYLISDGSARQFSSGDVLHALGFSENQFLPVTRDELALQKPGPAISDPKVFPDGTLLKIDDAYYQFRQGKLDKFVSSNAYLSRYQDAQALNKDKAFLASQDVSQNVIGFADGTLAAYGQSVFILSDGKYYPVNSPETFQILGLNWEDVVPITPDELAIYKKQKIFTRNNPHPDGTIFLDVKTQAYYLVAGTQKLPLVGANLINSYLRNHPVSADSESLQLTAVCEFSKNFWPRRSYSCSVPLAAIKDLPGNDYQFTQPTAAAFQINHLRVTFHTSLNWLNLKDSLAHIKRSLTATYTGQ